MTATITPITDRLKTETRELHTLAERHPIQAAMVSGRVAAADYAALLAQLMHVHDALETELARHPDCAEIGAIVSTTHFHVERTRDDIRALGFEPDSYPPLPATEALIDTIRNSSEAAPWSLIGYHYVLEGSTNGGRFIARAIRKGLPLPDGQGTSYYDPYGEEQPAVWSAYKSALARVAWSEAQADTLVENAAAMFRGITEIMNELATRKETGC
jgi:heme oxygenase